MKSAVRGRSSAGAVASCVAVLAALAIGASVARADADPASDWLIQQDAFYPYTTKVSTTQQRALDAALASARKAGVPIKVAIIAGPNDLGAVSVLFRRPPDQYAKFLGTELSFVNKGRVLVVLPTGYGLWWHRQLPAREVTAIDALPPPASSDGDTMAAAADTAVQRLLALHGVQVARPPSTHSSTNADRLKIAGGALGLVAIGLGASMFRRRRT
jgi:hypothetical protein